MAKKVAIIHLKRLRGKLPIRRNCKTRYGPGENGLRVGDSQHHFRTGII